MPQKLMYSCCVLLTREGGVASGRIFEEMEKLRCFWYKLFSHSWERVSGGVKCREESKCSVKQVKANFLL